VDNNATVHMRLDGVDGAFTDITEVDSGTYLLREGSITITRGSGDAQDEIPPGQVSFRFRDQDAYLDAENPASPNWRKIGEGTHVLVKIDGVIQTGSACELKSVVPSWDESENAIVADVTASDVTDRLSANDEPLQSALSRYYSSLTGDEAPVHWWKFEEGPQATRAEDSAGNVPLVGRATFGNEEAPPGGVRSLQTVYEPRPDPVPDASTYLSNALPLGSTSYIGQDWAVDVSFRVPGDVVDSDLAPIYIVEWRTHSLGGYWQLLVNETTKCLDLYFFNGPFSTFTVTGVDPVRDGEWHHAHVEVVHSGGNFNVLLYVDNVLQENQLVNGAETSIPRLVLIYNFEDVDGALRPALCHLVLFGPGWPANALTYEAFLGHAGEGEVFRVVRICSENGIASLGDVYDDADIALGPQGANTLIDIVQSAVSTNAGLILADGTQHETLRQRQRFALWNQPAAVTLTYSHLAPGFQPAADDQRRVNRVTASADSTADASATAGEHTYTIPDGDWFHWTTEPPPEGNYARAGTARYNPEDPEELIELAAWKAHLSSWRQKRYAAITLELHRPAFTADEIAAVRALDVGDVIEFDMAGAPAWVPYDSLRVMVRGWTRNLTKFTDTYVFSTSPADAWEVEHVDGDTTLIAAVDDNDTAILIANGDDSPPWEMDLEPYYAQIDGDPVKVTTMALTTPALVAAGTPAHADNTTIAPALPAGITVDVGQSVFLWCAIRNTAASVIGTPPSGWTLITPDTVTHVALYHRYYVTGMGAPTVTPTGGAAGDTVSGVTFAYTNTTPVLDSTDGPNGAAGGYALSENSSAQNIAWPSLPLRTARSRGLRESNCLQLLLLWKQDDYTSIAQPSGWTEIVEASTTTGSDQSLYVAAKIVTDATAVTAGSAVVTGGASAVSKGVAVVVRPAQSATVERGVAGIATSHAAGDPIHVWRPGLVGL
jgi:hypothetical protein